MLTKFIGSPHDFLNTSTLGLVLVSNNKVLMETNIPRYTLNNSVDFDTLVLIPRNEDGKFKIQVDNHFSFNYIIMYDNYGNPLGFVYINETVSTEKYRIELLEIKFDFVLYSKEVFVDIDLIDYAEHELTLGGVHKDLFLPKMRSSQALNRSKLNNVIPKESPFTNNIFSIVRDSDLVYRYSGNLSKGLKKMVSDEWVINEGGLIGLVDFFNINNKKVLVSKCQNLVTFYTNQSESKTIDMGFEPILIGDNFIVRQDGNKIELYSTKDIFEDKDIDESCISTLSEYDNVVIDPIGKDIMIYSFHPQNGSVPKSEKLKKIYSDLDIDFDLDTFNSDINFELMYATNGLLVWYDSTSEETKLQTFYSTTPFSIQGEIKDAVFLTKDLLIFKLVGDTNNATYLYEINQNFKTNKFDGTFYVLGSNGKYRRLDKLSKNRIRDVQQVNLLSISSEGCLWTSSKENSIYKITKL